MGSIENKFESQAIISPFSNNNTQTGQEQIPSWLHQTRSNVRRRNFYETSKFEEIMNLNIESQETISILLNHSAVSQNYNQHAGSASLDTPTSVVGTSSPDTSTPLANDAVNQLLAAMYNKSKSDFRDKKIMELEKKMDQVDNLLYHLTEEKQHLETQLLNSNRDLSSANERIIALEDKLGFAKSNAGELATSRSTISELQEALKRLVKENVDLKLEIEEQNNLASVPGFFGRTDTSSSGLTFTATDLSRDKIGWNIRDTLIKPPTDVCTTSNFFHTSANTSSNAGINTNRITTAIANATVGKYIVNGDYFVSGGADGILRFHNSRDRNGVHSLGVCKQPITSLSVSPNTKLLCFGSLDRYAYICPSTARKNEVISVVHNEPLSGCAFLSNSLLVTTTATRANCINIIWDLHDTSKSTKITQESAPVSLSGAVRAGRFATSHYDKSIKIWQLTSSDAICLNPIEDAHDQRITSVLFSHNENYIASTGYDAVVNVRDMRNPLNSLIWALSQPEYINKNPNTSFCFSPDDKYIVAGSDNGALIYWDLRNPSEPVSMVHRHRQIIKNFTTSTNPNAIIDLDWNQNGKQVGAVTNAGRILFFDHEKNIR